MDNAIGAVLAIGIFAVVSGIEAIAGLGSPDKPDCGDAVASQEVCEEVVARANEVGTVPEGHEQRDRARGG